MFTADSENLHSKSHSKQKILFILLPFWTPLIPPLGIACLKSALQKHGYRVKTVDANLMPEFREIYQAYFNVLATILPENKKGNFYNMGHDVLRNHLMVYLNREEGTAYVEFIKTILYKHFFVHAAEEQVEELDKVAALFFVELEKYMTDLLEVEKPDVLGISVYSGTLPASLFTFRLAKEKCPGIMTVMGGGIFADQLSVDSPNYKNLLDKSRCIDKILIGEGELLFLKLLQGELPQEQKVFGLKDIQGEVLELSKSEIPDFSDFDTSQYPQITAYASRSCPFQCSFCSETVQWGKYRKKTAVQIADELEVLSQKYQYQLFLLGDSLLNPVVSQLAQELVLRKYSLYWDGYLRADAEVCNMENALLWRQGGFYRARLGVESGSEHVLKLMDKRITPEQIKASVTSLSSAGIKTTTYWVIGYPGETEDDFLKTLQLIEELRDDIYEAECNPFNYFPKGQVNSAGMGENNGVELLYPAHMTNSLLTQTWILKNGTPREVIFDRVCRFMKHCVKLGIPNPYSMQEIYAADERWRKLHKNAVPALVDFKNRGISMDENKRIGKLVTAKTVMLHEDDGDFEW